MIAKIILMFILTLSLGMGIATHGKERLDQNGWVSFVGFAIIVVLLYFGGFFNAN